jgi:hypothetical protein
VGQNNDVARTEEKGLEWLIVGVELTSRRESQPLADTRHEGCRRPVRAIFIVVLLVEAKTAWHVPGSQMQVRDAREIRSECQHVGRVVVSAIEDCRQSLYVPDVMSATLAYLDVDIECDDVIRGRAAALDESRERKIIALELDGERARPS